MTAGRTLRALRVAVWAGVVCACVFAAPPARGGKRVMVTALFDDATAAKRSIVADDVVLAAPAHVARFTAVRLEVSEERVRELEHMPGVRVWPWTPPTPHDEGPG
ncbi:MAG TPA: hypothetical protein PLF26_07915, partial [Blastocatellia bacterium]|nr:hypothetical protein [Blastocatellia bacterium]